MESIITYGIVILITASIFVFYLSRQKKTTRQTMAKIEKAKEMGLHEPVSLHPVVSQSLCIGSGACIQACPEKDILGIVNGRAVPINTSRCVGHGACFEACPVHAITLCMGTEKRGVDLPHVSKHFESSIPMLFIVGELGGMGLIKNAVAQSRQALDTLLTKLDKQAAADYDIAIIGAGPAGITATLGAAEHKLKYVTFEQNSLGGAIASFPRQKVIMTSPMDIPLYGKIKLGETSKSELLNLWQGIFKEHSIVINENEKVESIKPINGVFKVTTTVKEYTSRSVILAIGRTGSPRKLGVPGEDKEKVMYRLVEPDYIKDKNVLVVGGGDSAVENALMLVESGNSVTLSYRGEAFSRIKEKNLENITAANEAGKVAVYFNSQVREINDRSVELLIGGKEISLPNDLVYVFIGGEVPRTFLEKIGITISTKRGDALFRHE